MWLVVESGPERGRAVQVGEDPVTIGSAPGRTLELGGARVAPLHAAVRIGLTGKLELVPLDLHAPLSVDGHPLTGTVSVHEGARIEVGAVVLTLRAHKPPESRTGPAERPSTEPARRRRWPVPWR
ncbi:MAG TPA: FHA domain-containing protein [Solirubrobacteraceae bacterium]|nr:FHA domain-containing protein [Solirubrobacteraceae bacterium]